MKTETMQAIREAIKAENPHADKIMDLASMMVISTLIAVQQVDAFWEDAGKAGTPSTTDYAARVIGFLSKQHGTGDVRL